MQLHFSRSYSFLQDNRCVQCLNDIDYFYISVKYDRNIVFQNIIEIIYDCQNMPLLNMIEKEDGKHREK